MPREVMNFRQVYTLRTFTVNLCVQWSVLCN